MLALTSQGWAQPTLVDPIEVFEGSLDDPENNEIAIHWDVTNLTSDTLNLMVTRSIVQLVSPYNLPYNETAEGAYDRFCWGPLCYPFGTTSSFETAGFLVELLPEETDTTFIADYYPAGVAGVTAFNYCFHPAGNVDGGTCQMVLFCLDAENCALGILDSQQLQTESIFPQPITGISSFPYQLNGATSAQMRIVNVNGQLVEQTTLTNQQGVVYLNAQDYAPGIYVITLTTDEGLSVSDRFIVQH